MSLFSKQHDQSKLVNSVGQALKKLLLTKIEEPLPILAAHAKTFGDSLPKFVAPSNQEPLGDINGRPFKEIFAYEQDLFQYLKSAYEHKLLVYCKQCLEIDSETNELITNPINLTVNINSLLNPP